MSRINGNSKVFDAIVLMAEGNPGALTVCSRLVAEDMVMGTISLLILDEMGIYGSQIWVAYKDVCKENLTTLIERVMDRDPGLRVARERGATQ